MRPYDVIWDYVGACYDNEGYIPDVEEVEEAVGHDLTLDGLELIEEITERFMDFHDMTDIVVNFEKEKTFKEKLAELEQLRIENHKEVS